METEKKKQAAYAIFRFTFGINMFLHGATRTGGNAAPFIEHMIKMFENSIMPEWFVRAFAVAVIPLEIAVGISLILGLFTFAGGTAGALLMSCFVFGACLLQNWSLAGAQMVYVIGFFFLLFFQEYDGYGADTFRRKRKSAPAGR